MLAKHPLLTPAVGWGTGAPERVSPHGHRPGGQRAYAPPHSDTCPFAAGKAAGRVPKGFFLYAGSPFAVNVPVFSCHYDRSARIRNHSRIHSHSRGVSGRRR